jgi:N-acetylglucosamine-6-phosphate deacetylase
MSPERRGLGDDKVMIKLTIPEVSDLYKPVEDHPRTLRIAPEVAGSRPVASARKSTINQRLRFSA